MRRRVLTLTIAVTTIFMTMWAHVQNPSQAAGSGGLVEQRSAQAKLGGSREGFSKANWSSGIEDSDLADAGENGRRSWLYR